MQKFRNVSAAAFAVREQSCVVADVREEISDGEPNRPLNDNNALKLFTNGSRSASVVIILK